MPSKKYNRSNLYTSVSINNNEEYDLSSSHFELFNTIDKVRLYQVSKYEAGRPDIISKMIYDKVDYWWILMRYNDIVDVMTELKSGFILKVPSARDIQDFMKSVRKAITEEKKSERLSSTFS